MARRAVHLLAGDGRKAGAVCASTRAGVVQLARSIACFAWRQPFLRIRGNIPTDANPDAGLISVGPDGGFGVPDGNLAEMDSAPDGGTGYEKTGCSGGQTCSNGTCVCPTYQSFCNGTCIPTSIDPKNCGRCGVKCEGALACSAGACSSTCLPGLDSCSNSCVDRWTDNNNLWGLRRKVSGRRGLRQGSL